MNRPAWWNWDLELTPHLRKRMIQRDFTEIDLREMWDRCHRVHPDEEEGRWILETTRGRETWEIVVEPDSLTQAVVVITAYSED